MPSYSKPTDQEIEEARLFLAHPQMQRAFFEGLSNPHWLIGLKRAGFFENPPTPIVDEAAGTTQFRAWPQMAYLRHVAESGDSEHLAVLVDILMKIETDDPYIREDILSIAALLPSGQAEAVAKSQLAWLQGPAQLWPGSEDAVLPLIRRLLSTGKGKTAEQLLFAAVGVRQRQDAPTRYRIDRVTAKLEPYAFREIWLGIAPELASILGLPGARVILVELDRALKIECPGPNYEFEADVSEMLCRNIRPQAGEPAGDFVGSLALALLECLKALCDNHPIAEVLDIAESSRWLTVRRIALQLLAETPSASIELVAERLNFESLFGDGAPPEAWHLLRGHWARLDGEFKARYFDLAFNVPVETVETWNQWGSSDDVARWQEGWTMTYLSRVADALSAEEQQRFKVDIGKVRTWQAENAGPPAGVAVGVKSPMSATQLLELDDDALLTFINDWKPGAGKWWVDRYALAGQWREAVKKEPQRILGLGEKLLVLRPDLAWEFIRGLSEAIKEGKRPSSDSIRAVLSWAVRDRFAPDEGREMSGAILSLTDSLLRAGTELLEQGDRELLWALISKYVQDPDPTPEYEEEYGPPNMDAFTLALNTTRARAIRLAIDYALWLRRSDVGEGGLPDEVEQVLTRHLDPRFDPSIAVRSVYGAYLPQLFLLKRSWLEANLSRVFPEEQAQARMFRAACEAYILYSRYYVDLFPVIRSMYEHAVATANCEDWEHRGDRTISRLAQHLHTAYIQGLIEADDHVITRFYTTAGVDMRKEALTHLGYDLKGVEGELSSKVLERWMEFWERIMSVVPADSDRMPEAAAFGPWFESGVFPPEWSLEQLGLALERCVTLEDSHGVMEKLGELAADYPSLVLPVLEHIIDHPESVWALGLWRKSAARIIAGLRQSDDPTIHKRVEKARNNLGAKGLLDLADA